ncbi:venom allergen 5-like [Drosophila novamexicana]|uniref:venom allergen 5-like n=1 Tax=Drosophila novamexicana TaxID=47314 RepID=UPI0011E5A89D|nr:venom allergen 5-like [Drosophila novamexicana]
MRLLSLQLLLAMLQLASGYNYCRNESHLCNMAKRRHFICNVDSELHPLFYRAKFLAIVPDTLPFRKLILDYHNKYRNMAAGGELVTDGNETFPAASRMRELIWDLELAYMARVHASTVSFKHTICRSVVRFPHAGENLSMVLAKKKRFSVKELLDLALFPMFEEYRTVRDPVDLLKDFDSNSHHLVGHFTLMVNDRVSRLGCAFAIATNCDKNNTDDFCHFMTCHYDFINMEGSYTYKIGNAASNCGTWGTWPSSKYRNLCTNNGEIFPKDHDDNDSKLHNVE